MTSAMDVGVSCAQTDSESNDSLPMAQDMPVNSCTPVTVTGTLASGDVDYFKAHGVLCDAKPPRLQVKTDGVHACLFTQCSLGSTGFDGCGAGSVTEILPSGLLGCCVSGIGAVDLNPKCNSDKKDMDVYLVVDQGPACSTYEIDYHL